ncbi:MAG TPA: vancomycin resistance protein [Clostridiales bacterium]|nr:vancomycin resistance protein [Clostridiales bacterium]
MKRKLFCEISCGTYRISVIKCRVLRFIKDLLVFNKFAEKKSEELLPVIIYKHNSLIRRRLGNVDMQLQENKAVNLSLAAPKVNKILIEPGQLFSFWHLVGDLSPGKGYMEGLTISLGKASKGIGGGMCQFTNLIHWMILHTDMTVTEHHHHEQIDLFPDYNRQIPFGTGTSILYNYLDYRFKNNTDLTYQLITYTTNEYLCGEIRANKNQKIKYHIKCRNEFFSKEEGSVYRNGEVYRQVIDCRTGKHLREELLRKNHAKVAYDVSDINIVNQAFI